MTSDELVSVKAGVSPLVVNDTFVCVQVTEVVADVLTEFMRENRAELDARLSQYGVELGDIVVPIFEQIVYVPVVEETQDSEVRP